MRNSPWNIMMCAAITCVATAGISLAADAPSGSAPAPPLPAAVATDLKAIADQCTEVGGKPLTDDAVKRVDLTGDGMDDFVLDVGSVNCDGAASIYGDREKGVTVYVGDGKGGATSGFSDSAYAATIETAGSAASLWLTVSGERCGRAPAQDFANENFCDRAIVWNAGTLTFDFAPVASVRMIE